MGGMQRTAALTVLATVVMGLLLGAAFRLGSDHPGWAFLVLALAVVAMFGIGWTLRGSGAGWILALAAVWAAIGIGGVVALEGAMAIWLAPAAALGLFASWRARRRGAWRRDGQPATGIVLEARRMPMVVNNYVLVWRVRMRVEPDDGSAPFEGTTWMQVPLPDAVETGAEVPLLVDPARPGKFVLDDRRAAAGRAPRLTGESLGILAGWATLDDARRGELRGLAGTADLSSEKIRALLPRRALTDAEFVEWFEHYARSGPDRIPALLDLVERLSEKAITRAEFDRAVRSS